jgi:hypothetical protein
MPENVALGGTELVQDEVEEGGLAGTVGTDDTWGKEGEGGREGGREGRGVYVKMRTRA